MEDFLSVFDEAGWDHDGDGGIIYGHSGNKPDPVGVLVLVNSKMAAQKRGPAAIAPLLDTISRFNLTPPRTLTPSDDVDANTIGLVIGRKP
jgi:hypothetical protein